MYVCMYVCMCVCMSMCVCMCVYVHVWMSVCLSVCLYVCLSVCLPACLAGWLPAWLAGWLSGCLAVWLSVCLSAWLSVCLYVCMHACWAPGRSLTMMSPPASSSFIGIMVDVRRSCTRVNACKGLSFMQQCGLRSVTACGLWVLGSAISTYLQVPTLNHAMELAVDVGRGGR